MNILNNGDLSENLFIVRTMKNGFISSIFLDDTASKKAQANKMQQHFIEQGTVVDHWVWSRGLRVRPRTNTDYKRVFDGVSPFIVESEVINGYMIFVTKEFGFNTSEEVHAFAQKILDCGGPPLDGLAELQTQKVFPEPQTLDEWILANWPSETLELMKTSEWMAADPPEQGRMLRAMLDKAKVGLGMRDALTIASFLRFVRIRSKNKND